MIMIYYDIESRKWVYCKTNYIDVLDSQICPNKLVSVPLFFLYTNKEHNRWLRGEKRVHRVHHLWLANGRNSAQQGDAWRCWPKFKGAPFHVWDMVRFFCSGQVELHGITQYITIYCSIVGVRKITKSQTADEGKHAKTQTIDTSPANLSFLMW